MREKSSAQSSIIPTPLNKKPNVSISKLTRPSSFREIRYKPHDIANNKANGMNGIALNSPPTKQHCTVSSKWITFVKPNNPAGDGAFYWKFWAVLFFSSAESLCLRLRRNANRDVPMVITSPGIICVASLIFYHLHTYLLWSWCL